MNNFQPPRAGEYHDSVTRPSIQPIFQTTAFDVDDLDQLESIQQGRAQGDIYTRDSNPNHASFANAVAQLEGAEVGITCSSGMGGMAAAVMAHVKTGDHIVAARVLYGKTLQMLEELSSRFGVDVSYADATRPETFANATTDRTKIAVVETLSNPLLEVTDFTRLKTAIGNTTLLVDSTFTTPTLFRPMEHGADLVFHSASKYLNGHGDVMLGIVVGQSEPIQQIAHLTSLFGMNANPFDSWLAQRGLRTIELRMPRVSQTAQTIAEFLDQHAAIKRVYYPGLESHPQSQLAARLMPNGCSGMLSFELIGGDRNRVNQLMQALPSIPFSPTLADARTTVSYPAGTSHVHMTPEERSSLGVSEGLVRLSVGLEPAEQLVHELSQALQSLA
ncbi:UNVERIFIED_CONTAM: hypothetical protein GTU68_024382 [Idotea baltica]|nr:hypothetical protein [Idotea baltica]